MISNQQSEIEEYAKKELRVLRQKLLDLTRRNKLLNFRHRKAAKNQLRIVDEVLEFSFDRLASGKDFQIAPLPDPDDDILDPDDEKTPEFRLRVEELKETDDYKAKQQTLEERLATESDVDAYERGLESLLRETKDNARKSLEMPPLGKSMLRSAVDWALINKIEPSYELPQATTGSKKHEDNKLQTLHFRKSLDGILNSLSSKASLIMGEKGVNTLYAAFGFLEWYESRNSNVELLSPIILLPLNIEKDFKRGEQVYTISSAGDPVVNETLRVKLQLEGIELPEVGDDQELDLAEYLKELEEVIDAHSRWKIHRYLTLGLFSFHKIAMYEDLDPEAGEDGRKPHQNELVSTIIAGRSRDPNELSQEPEIHNPDEYERLEDLPKLILDADSSQFSAVVDALAGKNLIIQGPPGTGKSQTISNIIGAAMVANKSVLFVSEKLSALQVVKKRLDEYGVGDYCLEIHSNKSNRAEFVAELSSRLNLQTPRRRGVPDINAQELKRRKNRIKRYLDLMQKEIAHSGVTVEEALWLSQKGDYTSLPLEVRHFRFSNATSIHRNDILRLKKELKALIEIRARLGRDIKDSPWDIFQRDDASSRLVADILGCLENALTRTESLVEAHEKFNSCEGVHCSENRSEMRKSLEILTSIPSPDSNRQELHSFLALTDLGIYEGAKNLYSLRKELGVLEKEIQCYSNISNVDDGISVVPHLEQILGLFKVFDASSVEALESSYESTTQDVDKVESLVEILQGLDGWTNPDILLGDTTALRDFSNIIKHLKDYPESIPEIYHSEALRSDETRGRIKQLKKLYSSLSNSLAGLVSDYSIQSPTSLNLSHVEQAIDQLKTKGIFSFFSSQFRQSKKFLRGLYGEQRDDASVVEQLEQIAKILQQQKKIEEDSIFSEFAVIGEYGQALEYLSQMSEWLSKLDRSDRFEQLLRIDLFDGNHYEDVVQIKNTIPAELLKDLLRAQESSASSGTETLNGYRQHLKDQCDCYKKYLQEYEGSHKFGSYTEPTILGLLTKVREYSESKNNEESATKLLKSKLETIPYASIEAIFPILSHLDLLKASNLIQLSDKMLTLEEYSEFHESITGISSGENEISQAVDQLTALIGGSKVKNIESVYELRSFLRELNDNAQDIEHVCDWLEIKRALETTQVKDALSLVESGHSEELLGALDMVYALGLIDVIREEYKELDQFSGSSLTKDRDAVREVDAQLSSVARYEIKEHLHNIGNEAPRGVGHGSKKSYTEMSLIHHQTSLTRPSMPPKRIIKQATVSLQKLFPCFMMSPLTVAEYLSKEACKFDLVVFDEASQIRPEDALGALLRANQFVVVGDNKQLPPTSFFHTSDDVVDDELDQDDIEEISSAESILEKAESTYGPSRMLLWHYRSQHPSLIAYSNREFYEDRLNIFPSPEAQSSFLGVKSHFIEDGVYGARCNLPEAQELIKGVVSHIRSYPNESIGIVAMNEAQRDLISGLLDLEFAHDEEINDYRIHWHETLEPIFVKNLENVQGDERDIMFVSTVYGKNKDGAMFQRFGPINTPNGHRRLNVLFTRAKRSVQLYTSLSPSDILVEENSGRGKRVFREYLEYARSGRLEAGVDTGRDPDSEFEIQVAEALRAKGYKCDYQVGVSGFFIDLAVQHPANSNNYILGVECDGAKYHSFKSARDRDRLREDALVSKGWKLHRIWSTDWFKNRDKEVERLIDSIEAILTNKGKQSWDENCTHEL